MSDLCIVSWQSVLTEHQVHTWRAIQSIPGIRVLIIVGARELAQRRVQGWSTPDTTGLTVLFPGERQWFTGAIKLLSQHRTSLHLFGGLWADRKLFIVILLAALRGMPIGLITEPYSDASEGLLHDAAGISGQWKKLVRPLAYRIAGMLLGARMKPILAISPKAVTQLTRAGFDREHIFPFGYFVPRAPSESANPASDGPLRLAFVGALIARKGLDVALRAMARCAQRGIAVCLDVFGPGDASAYEWADAPGVRFKGAIPFGRTQNVLRAYHAVVVPSRFDGWGVVVNEALLQGVPAITSSAVGAAAAVAKWNAGAVFASGSDQELASIIESAARDRGLIETWRSGVARLAPHLTPEAAAAYLIQCVKASRFGAARPPCPWYD